MLESLTKFSIIFGRARGFLGITVLKHVNYGVETLFSKAMEAQEERSHVLPY